MFQVRASAGIVLAIATVVTGLAPVQGNEVTGFAAALESITAAELKAHVDVLADDTFEGREGGSRGGRAAGNYLAKELDKHGLKPAGDGGTFFQSFGGSYRNVLGLLEGSDPKLQQEVIIVGAHYDHVGYGRASNSYGPTGYIHNGADDNASGTAGLLETVEAFRKLPSAPRRSVLFAFWDGEENGLLGSAHWVANPTLGKRRATFMLNLDMIGRLRKDRLEVYGSRTSFGLRKLLSRGNAATELDLAFDWNMKADSDHYSFFAKSIPTVMFHTGLHEDYHRPSDDAHKVNAEGIHKVTKLLFRFTLDLADQEEVTTFRAASRRESAGSKSQLEEPLANPQPRLGVTWQQHDPAKPGLVVATVGAGSAAERAGIRSGDRLLEFAGRPVQNALQFTSEVLASASTTSVLVERSGAKEPLNLPVALSGKPVRVGIGWREDDAEPGSVLLTQVLYGSPAHRAGLLLRDRLYEIGGEELKGGVELRERLAKLQGPVELLVERRGQLKKLMLELPAL